MRLVKFLIETEEVDKKFKELANGQRGDPEIQMVRIQKLLQGGGAPLSGTLEHVGDITHRMSALGAYNDYGYYEVVPKVKRCLSALTQGYGFKREYDENLDRHIIPELLKKNPGKTEQDIRHFIDTQLEKYAYYHSQLPVYNQVQWLAQHAAMALGYQSYNGAAMYLEKLNKFLVTPEKWNEAASQYTPNYKPNVNESVLAEDAASDIRYASLAHKMAKAFAEWLYEKSGYGIPISDQMEKDKSIMHIPDFNGYNLLGTTAVDLGFPFENIYLFIGERGKEETADGYLLTGKVGDKKILMPMVFVDFEPLGQPEISLTNRNGLFQRSQMETMAHEIIHAFDYIRGANKANVKDPETDGYPTYYNSPLEFNAFFQMSLPAVLKYIKDEWFYFGVSGNFDKVETDKIISYPEFHKQIIDKFDSHFLEHLDDKYKRKFEKRLYQIYQVMTQTWSDFDAFQKKIRTITESVLLEKVLIIDNESGTEQIKIYHNPSFVELSALAASGNIRGTYSKTNGIFVWNARDAIHYYARTMLNREYHFDISTTIQSAGADGRDFSIYGKDLYVQSYNKYDANHPQDKEAILNYPPIKRLGLKPVIGY